MAEIPPLTEPDEPRRPLDPEGRYLVVERIGQGSAAEVVRAVDRHLGRTVAVKVLHPGIARHREMIRRFQYEARVLAQLQHPAIVPIHDLGALPDGRWFLAMKELRGQTMRELVERLHAARRGGPFVTLDDGWNLRRAIDVFHKVCGAMGFAHARGVIHRDLKPDNVVIGDYGEVVVVDWGLAMVLAERGEGEAVDGALRKLSTDPCNATAPGVVVGTPAYMAPEQARGEPAAMGRWSDVWSLGGILHTVLYGALPYRGKADQVLRLVRQGPPRAPREDEAVPESLVAVWRKCMQSDPVARYRNAQELYDEIGGWLEGTRARDRALALVNEATALLPAMHDAAVRASKARERARAAVVGLRESDPLETKENAWAMEDEAELQQEEAESRYVDVATRARAALSQAADLPEARALLAGLYRERAEAAEAAGDRKAAREYLALLAEHDDGQHADYLRSVGELTVETRPRGGTVRVLACQPKARRLVTREVTRTGPTPVRGVRLPIGSYVLELHAPDRAVVRYPVHLSRGQPWHSVPPGGDAPVPVDLPPLGSIGPGERLVAAGWFLAGGDPDAAAGLPRQRLWIDDFVIAAGPVTHADYKAFLDDLSRRGRSSEAHVPREVTRQGAHHRLLYRRGPDGTWAIPEDATSDQPVVGLTLWDARAYCRWLAERTGAPWRLPGELEREKAARGVDGRAFPWGDRSDPAFHCVAGSANEANGAPPTSRFPVDTSPYDVFGLAGGVQEWCAEPFHPHGPPRKGPRVVQPGPITADDLVPRQPAPPQAVRGGAWNLPARMGRAASRASVNPGRRAANLGFRICRTLEPAPED